MHVNPRSSSAMGPRSETARALAEALHLDGASSTRSCAARRYFTWVKRRITPDEARAVRALALPGVFLSASRGATTRTAGWPGRSSAGPASTPSGRRASSCSTTSTCAGARARCRGCATRSAAQCSIDGGGGERASARARSLHDDRSLHPVPPRAARSKQGVHDEPRQGRRRGGARPEERRGAGDGRRADAQSRTIPTAPRDGPGARNRAVTDPVRAGLDDEDLLHRRRDRGRPHPSRRDLVLRKRPLRTVRQVTIHDAEPDRRRDDDRGARQVVEHLHRQDRGAERRERVDDVLRRFGFGQPTGIDLPGERAGQLRSVGRWGRIETGDHVVRAGRDGDAAADRGGATRRSPTAAPCTKPHVTRRITDDRGARDARGPAGGPPRRVRRSWRHDAHDARTRVTQKGGTAREARRSPATRRRGKTGTAQKVDPATRRYSTEKWAASFVGFAPIDHPRLVIFVHGRRATGLALRQRGGRADLARGHGRRAPLHGVPPSRTRWPRPLRPTSPPVTRLDRRRIGRTGQRNRQGRTECCRQHQNGTRDHRGHEATGRTAMSTARGRRRARGARLPRPGMGEALDAARRAGLPVEVIGTGVRGAVADRHRALRGPAARWYLRRPAETMTADVPGVPRCAGLIRRTRRPRTALDEAPWMTNVDSA